MPPSGESPRTRARTGFLLAVAASLVSLGWAWTVLPPGEVPMHFNLSGEADRWGTRDELAMVLGVLLVVLALVFGWAARSAATMSWVWINVPHKEFWALPDNDAVARARLRDDLFWLGAAVSLLFAALPWLVVWEVRGIPSPTQLNLVIFGGVGIWVVATSLLVHRRNRFYRGVDTAWRTRARELRSTHDQTQEQQWKP